MSWLLGTYGTMERLCLGSQGLEDDDEFSYSCHSVLPPTQHKSYDRSGNSQVPGSTWSTKLGESIPFSQNSRHSYMVKDKEKNRIYAKILAEHALALEEEAEEFQEPFYKDTEMPGSLSKDEDHSWTYHLPVHQRLRVLQTASMTPSSSYDSFQCSMGKHLGMDAFDPCAYASDPYLGDPEHTREAESHMLPEEAFRDREFSSLLLTNDIVKKENAMLRRVVRSMQSSLKSQACMRRRLERELAQEEREVQKLQSFVQQTEWSLQLMTQRALEAEGNVEKLKQEIFILQGELESSKAENENLRASQTTNLGAAKHNIDFALQNLNKIIMGTNLSIRQLSSEAKSLYFVAEVLKSTGKISEVEAEKEL